MNDPVDRVIVDRQRTVDVGFRQGVVASLVAHLVLVGLAFGAPLLFPREPPLMVADGFAVVLPRGGGGDPNAGGPQTPPPMETPAPPEPAAPEPPAPEPPKVLKPPKEEPRKGLPELDSRRKAKKPDKPAARKAAPEAKGKAAAAGASTTGPGSSPGTPGLAIGPPGPGVPDGTDTGGDWYMAGVQQKIWTIWSRQLKTGFTRPVGVTFTILADGSVTDVQVTQPSGVTLLDLAAQRAILTAAPFGPLPRIYDTNRKTIQAVFQPTT